jgi:hypothetical protein
VLSAKLTEDCNSVTNSNPLEKAITRQPHSGCHPLSKEGHWRESQASVIPWNMPLAYSTVMQMTKTGKYYKGAASRK